MPIVIDGVVIEDVETYEGKKGFGANILVSKVIDNKRKLLKFNTNDQYIAKELEHKLQSECTIQIELNQTNFGLRLGTVLGIA